MSKKILVIESDKGIREMLCLLLDSEGFYVKTFSQLTDMITDVVAYKPDVVLLDIAIPETQGVEVCKALKADFRTTNIPVIVMSTAIHIQTTIQDICADDVVPKPFEIDVLLSAINRQLAA